MSHSQKNGASQGDEGLSRRIESLESELAHVKAERDGLRKLLIRMLPEGDPTGWPSTEELTRMAASARPIEEILQEIAAEHGVTLPELN